MRAQYNNQLLQLFTSSLFIAGLLAGLVATVPTRQLGRRATMLVSCLPPHCSRIASWQACSWAPVLPDWLGALFLLMAECADHCANGPVMHVPI